MTQVGSALLKMYPDAVPNIDYRVQDDGDGKGPHIVEWNLAEPEPDDAALKAGEAAYNADRKATQYERDRQSGYDAAGADKDALLFALWELVVEGRSEAADALEVIRQGVKTSIPK